MLRKKGQSELDRRRPKRERTGRGLVAREREAGREDEERSTEASGRGERRDRYG